MQNSVNPYRRTIAACFVGYTVQACICTFAPLLYVQFRQQFGLSLNQLALMISVTFFTQLLVDLASSAFVEKIGYRTCIVTAHFLAAAGFAFMALLPEVMDAYTGLMIAAVVYSLGAGLIEVLISPIMEACPTKRKNAMMNLLHSCFAWGQMLVILLSTLFFAVFSIKNWKYLSLFWAVVPLFNAFLFLFAPINQFGEGAPAKKAIVSLLKSKLFWCFMLMMIASGATELAVSQWASALVETGLGVNKTVGDLTGPCMFAFFMGLGRLIGTRFDDDAVPRAMLWSVGLCIAAILLIALSPHPVGSLIGCALCGFAVSITWPMTLSLAAHIMPAAGTALFGFLACGGDVGCTVGPSLAGIAAARFGDDLKTGVLFSAVFPLLLLLGLLLVRAERKKKKEK